MIQKGKKLLKFYEKMEILNLIQSELNNGQLIVCRYPNKKYSKIAKDFIACAECKDFFSKNTIRYYSRSCFGKYFKKNKCIMIMGKKVTCRLHSSANEVVKKMIFPVMRDDEITRIRKTSMILNCCIV